MPRWLSLFLVHHVLSQDVQLQKIADAYSSWASASPYTPEHVKKSPPPQPSSVRQFTHFVTVQAPPPKPVPLLSSKLQPIPLAPKAQSILKSPPIPMRTLIPSRTTPFHSEAPRFSPLSFSPQQPLSQLSAQRLVRPQYRHNPMHFYHPRTNIQPSLSLPTNLLNSSIAIPQRNYPMMTTPTRKSLTDQVEDGRAIAAKKQRWGRPTIEFTCDFGFCGGGCCQPPQPPQPQHIHAAAMPGSLTQPLVLMLHPSPHPQCSPACQPMCLPQCTARLQYMPLPMPEFFHPQQPTCRSDCMPSCHVDCLIMPPVVIRCTSFPCQCDAGYKQCSPFTCCSYYRNMMSKFRSTVEDKSEEEKEKRRKLFTPVHIPLHGTPSTVAEKTTTTEEPSPVTTATRPTTTTTPSTITTPTTTTTTSTTTTTTPPPPPSPTTTITTTTTTPLPITPIYPESAIPLVPVYELWRPREKIQKAKGEEEIENFIRSNSFVEMLAELAQVKAKEDLNQTADDFIKYITETGK